MLSWGWELLFCFYILSFTLLDFLFSCNTEIFRPLSSLWTVGERKVNIMSTCVPHPCMLSRFSRVRLFETLWTAARQASLSMGFSRQEHWSGLPCPPPEHLPDPGIRLVSLLSPAPAGSSLPLAPPGKPYIPTFLSNSSQGLNPSALGVLSLTWLSLFLISLWS